jgi:hypothetical protein
MQSLRSQERALCSGYLRHHRSQKLVVTLLQTRGRKSIFLLPVGTPNGARVSPRTLRNTEKRASRLGAKASVALVLQVTVAELHGSVNQQTKVLQLDPTNHSPLLCSRFVRILPSFTIISIAFL